MRAIEMRLMAVVGLVLLLGSGRSLQAYERGTHQEIADVAVTRSNLDEVLKERYGVLQGTEAIVNGNSVRRWLQIGADSEDVPFFRALNHFHNPLYQADGSGLGSWAQAGLFPGQSSVLWQQNPNQNPGGTWSWPVARRRFLDFLTKPAQAERDTALADTARALGQVMHMLQDATSPAHVRNDPHPIFDGYEHRVDEMRVSPDPAVRARFENFLLAPPVLPSPSIFTATGDDQAPVPIARLIDSDTYAGTIASYSPGGSIGAAEYTNGGYVSDDTIFLDFALPREASLDPVGFLETPPGASRPRRYFPKVADGDQVSHFVAKGTFLNPLRFRGQPLFGGYILDDRTYEAAATHLLPRAVGYSAGLLDYFFRGELEIAPPEEFVYARAAYLPGNAGQFTTLRAKVRNVTELAGALEPLGAGTLTAVVRYRTLGFPGFGAFDPFEFPTFPISAAEAVARSAPVPVGEGTLGGPLTNAFQEIMFDFSQDPIPTKAVDVRLQVLYQGPVGLEPQGLAVGLKDLLEPDPVDYVNGSDWECFAGVLYHVADFTLFPPYPPGGYEPARDIDQDGVVDLIGPAIERGVRLKAADPFLPLPVPSEALFDLTIPEADARQGAQLGRVVVLQDRPFYGVVLRSDQIVEAPTGLVRPGQLGAFLFGGVVNDLVLGPTGLVHRVTLSHVYRGSAGFHRIILVTGPTIPCLGATATLEPPLSLIPSPPAIIQGVP